MNKPNESTIGVFAGFPPEHNAHIIEAVFTVRALQEMRFRDIVGVTASLERPSVQVLDEGLAAYCAENILHPLSYPHIPIANVQEAVDGYDIKSEHVHKLIEEFGIDVFYLTYHPLFGAKLIDAVGQTRRKILLLAKMALVLGGQSALFSDYHRDYDRSLERANGIITLQENEAALVQQYYPQTEGKVHVVHKFVDDEFLTAAKRKAPEILDALGIKKFVGESKQLVGCFGRIDPEKNAILMAKEIWPRVMRQLPSARLVMVGAGKQSNELRSIVHGTESIHLIEKQVPYMEILALLSHMDVLAFPSGTDYTPRMPMDALLMGSRVVACDLSFNDVFRPYAKLVPTTEFQRYKPYGFNDNARLLSNCDYMLPYGVPDSETFSDGILQELSSVERVPLPEQLFTVQGFCAEFRNALGGSGNI